jgi:hypothetical protein
LRSAGRAGSAGRLVVGHPVIVQRGTDSFVGSARLVTVNAQLSTATHAERMPFRPDYRICPGDRLEVEVVQPDGVAPWSWGSSTRCRRWPGVRDADRGVRRAGDEVAAGGLTVRHRVTVNLTTATTTVPRPRGGLVVLLRARPAGADATGPVSSRETGSCLDDRKVGGGRGTTPTSPARVGSALI